MLARLITAVLAMAAFSLAAVVASRLRKTPIFLGRELLRLAIADRHLGEPASATHNLVREALAIADRTGATVIQQEAQRLGLLDLTT